jgi:hypothetical protein
MVMRFLDPADGVGLLTDYLNESVMRVLVVFIHGVGDLVMFLKSFESLRSRYPTIQFDLGLANWLDQDKIFPAAVLLEPDWRAQVSTMSYDLVFYCHFPMEDSSRATTTKAELCCEQELGIEPVSEYPRFEPKKIIAVHFHSTAVPDLANAREDIAKKIWGEIGETGFVPIEIHFEHIFHNARNSRFDFVDQHVRNWPARLETLMALLGSSAGFVGVASGPFHLALSILGPDRVLLLEKELRGTQLTKAKVATANLKGYRGEVRSWLERLRCVSAGQKS